MSSPRLRLRIHSDGRRYHIQWFCEDSVLWHEVLDDFKYEFEPWERRFEPGPRMWSVPLAYRARVRAWAKRWFDADSREFTEDEPAGHGYEGRSYSQDQNSYARYGASWTSTGTLER
jgi:hypothetical protein